MTTTHKTTIALYGTAGIGKTTVARKICRKLPGRTARLSTDVLRDMACVCLKGGWKESDNYIVAAKKVLVLLAKEYIKLGYNVIIEVAPPTIDDAGKTDKQLTASLKKMGAKVFLLDASLKTILNRNKKRRGEFGQGNLSKKLTEKLYNYSETYLDKKEYVVINTEKMGADKITSLILKS
jgi:adenylate kinase family enzyme